MSKFTNILLGYEEEKELSISTQLSNYDSNYNYKKIRL